MISQETPSCFISADEILAVLTERKELVVLEETVGARLLLAVCAANDELEKAA